MRDLVIIGEGPAGYTAGIYATRYNLNVLIIGAEQGGLIAETPEIENWPGMDQVSGTDLMDSMKKQYLRLGGEIKEGTVIDISKKENFVIKTTDNELIETKTIILATGTKPRVLNIEGELKFKGRGVSYCSTCDAPFFKDKVVAVAGGGNSAFTSALHLYQYAKKVYIIHRRDEFRGQPAIVDKLRGKVEFLLSKKIKRIEGKLRLETLVLEDIKTGKDEELNLDGLFVSIGHIPTTMLTKTLNVDTRDGFVKVSEDMSTNVAGFFAAGDCTTGSNGLRQVVTAVSEGAIATDSVYKFIHNICR